MKKKYSKPCIVIESFQLDAAIAASCSSQNFIPINYNENGCGFLEMGQGHWQFFNYDNCETNLVGSGGDNNDQVCYHGPFDAPGMTFVAS